MKVERLREDRESPPVEAPNELLSLNLQVLLHGEVGASLFPDRDRYEPLLELLGGAVRGHCEFTRESQSLGLPSRVGGQLDDPALEASEARGHRMRSVRRTEDQEPRQAVGMEYPERQAHHSAVRRTDPGV